MNLQAYVEEYVRAIGEVHNEHRELFNLMNRLSRATRRISSTGMPNTIMQQITDVINGYYQRIEELNEEVANIEKTMDSYLNSEQAKKDYGA